jgi:hypothetical protein
MTFPPLAGPAFSDQPPNDDDHLREDYPGVHYLGAPHLVSSLCHKEGPLYTYLVLSCALAVSTELTLALLSVYFPSAPHRALPAAQVAKLQLLSRCYDKLIDMCLFEVGPYVL